MLSLLDRTSGRVSSRVIEFANSKVITEIVSANVSAEARFMTDESSLYFRVGKTMAQHSATNHKLGEYVRLTDRTIHTNTVEGYFSIFKRGMKGIYQHCAEHHLHRYLAEFDFRYSNRSALGIEDAERADRLLRGVVGKRLTYERAGARA